jgi:hypothetical protein
LRRKIKILTNPGHNTWINCKPVINALLESIEKRFGNYLNFTTPQSLNATIAALSYLRFEKRWMICIKTEFQDKIIQIFKKTANEILVEKIRH